MPGTHAGVCHTAAHPLRQEMMLTEGAERERRGDAAGTSLAGCVPLHCYTAVVQVAL